MSSSMGRAALAGAGITVLSLFGEIFLGFVVGNTVFNVLPNHSIDNPNPVHILLAALPALAGLVIGSAVWGAWMGRLAHAPDAKRMALAGALGFAPITLLLAGALEILEPLAVDFLGAQFPLPRIFTLFFVPTAFLAASTSAWAIGKGLRNPVLAHKLFYQVGIAAALAFLGANLVMEASGWQVGAPNAEVRFTMLTVLFVGNFGAALAGGAVLGGLLAQSNRVEQTILGHGIV